MAQPYADADSAYFENQSIVIASSAPTNGLEKREYSTIDKTFVVHRGDLVMLTTDANGRISKLRRMVFAPLSLEEREAEHNLRQLREEPPELLSTISGILYDVDPIGNRFEDNTDGYDGEAAIIITRLGACSSAADVQTVVHEEFVRWWGAYNAGRESDYKIAEIAAAMIWDAWQSYENQ